MVPMGPVDVNGFVVVVAMGHLGGPHHHGGVIAGSPTTQGLVGGLWRSAVHQSLVGS
jgi:hypothetical protein